MEENFFSLDDILLSHERLPCRTDTAFPKLGFLEKSGETHDIPEVTLKDLISKSSLNTSFLSILWRKQYRWLYYKLKVSVLVI